MAHLQYMPGDPRLVDQLVYELKSKGIFDQFRKDCIADVDTRPAYQNLRQRVENSVSSFLARQVWKPDLNKNQLREKLRKHVLEGNYLEQGVERIVDQVVNPKLATVFVPKVEDLVYDYLGITRKKNSVEASNGIVDLLPTDLEAVSPGSVKSNEDKDEAMEVDVINEPVDEQKNAEMLTQVTEKIEEAETSGVSELTIPDSDVSDDKDSIPLPAEEIRPEDIPPPENSPPKIEKVEVDKIELPKEQDVATDIPLPDEIPKPENGTFFKNVNSDDDSSSDSSLRRNMSPLTPIRSYNNENSCDAQQAFENQLIESKKEVMKEPSTFRFALDSKSNENSLEAPNMQKNESDLSYQLNQVNINNFITPAYEESSNSNNLHIDYESDANSKVNTETKYEADQTFEDTKKEKKPEEKKNRHKSSHRSRDSSKHSTNREKKSDSKPSSSRDSSRHGKKSSKDDKHKTNEKAKSKDRSEKKENKDSSRHRSSHQSSHKDSKSHRSSSSSHKHSSKSDDKKSTSSNQKDKDKNSYKSSSKDKYSKDSKSSSHHSDRERKSSSSNKSRSNDKDKKSKKDIDDHYSLSGRGNLSRRSTDRDSNDGSSSSKGSHQPSSSKSSESKKDSKESTSKSENSSGSGSTTPSEKEAPHDVDTKADVLHNKPIIRIETHLETPVASPPRLPFVPDITLKKPKIAANFDEAKKIMKMRKFLEEEQRRMNQEAALLLEFQANVRPSLSQVYSSIPGPELEFACNTKTATQYVLQNSIPSESKDTYEEKTYTNAELYQELNAGNETEMNSDNDNVELDDNKTIISLHVEGCEISNESEKANTTLSGDLKMSEIKGELIINKDHINLSEMRAHAKKNKVKKNKSREICKTENKKNKHKHYLENDKTGINIEKNSLQFFAQHEKYNSELEKTKYNDFLKRFIEKTNISDKLYLINCDTYEENVLKDVASTFGEYEIVSYHRNGQLKMPKTKAIVKNLNLAAEVSLPIDSQSNDSDIKCQVFSPGKSDCSFELSNDYDAKLEEMVNKTSRKEIMQIILGDVIDGSPSKMPKIDYITELNIDSAIDCNLKRKIIDTETTENNNRPILTPHKIRKMSTSELITSTTQDTEESKTNDNLANVRSKYLGRAKRVGLPRPKRTELPNSPSSDKSVENYEQNTPTKNSNGKVKAPRHLVQRYDTSDLYKPKLHFLSRRNVS